MKVVVSVGFVVACFLVARVSSAAYDAAPSEPSCPETPGTEPVYLPDPNDCTKYIVCSGAFGMKMDCPPGLHFNKKTSTCDYPPNAKCEEIPKEDPTKLKGPPGIKKDAYINMDATGLPTMTQEPKPGIGQLSDTSFVDEQASKGDDAADAADSAGGAPAPGGAHGGAPGGAHGGASGGAHGGASGGAHGGASGSAPGGAASSAGAPGAGGALAAAGMPAYR